MRYFLNRVVLIATFAVASAYMYHSPLNLRCHLHDLRSSSLLQRKLATNHDSFDEEWGSTKTPILRAKSVAQFCFEVSCTIQSYQKTIEKLKRRKRELSTQMLIVDDQLSEMKSVEERHLRIPGIPDFVDIQRFSSSWWTSFPKTLHSGVGRINKHDLHSDNHAENIMILEERRKSLSDRALAIQNLLISLQVMENTGTISAKELTNQYRRITVAERINIFSPAAPKHHHANGITIVVDGDAWGSIQTSLKQPQPPRFPPTFTQFMKQCRTDKLSDNDGNGEDDVNEKWTREWFARKRVAAYPFSTSAAAKNLANDNRGLTIRRVGSPLLPQNSNSTSILR